MTEQEWLTANKPRPMLKFLLDKLTERKLRLFAFACCRRIWSLLRDDRTRNAVEAGERYADSLISRQELRQAEVSGRAAFSEARRRQTNNQEYYAAAVGMGPPRNGSESRADWPAIASFAARAVDREEGEAWFQELACQSRLFRCVSGNPFRPVTIDQSWIAWNDGTIIKLAQAIYDEHDLPSGHLDAGRLAILADALEEAGCAHADILSHCRSPEPHVRGCWVVDLLLGKE